MTDIEEIAAGMKVVKAYPPNITLIDAEFHVTGKHGILFCYGDTIFNPSGVYVTSELRYHEAVHSERQLCVYWTAKDGREFPNWNPDEWWKRYIAEPEFRLSEEMFAHIREFLTIWKMTPNKRTRREYLDAIAKRLSGPLYGNGIDFRIAKARIYDGAMQLLEAE